MRKKFFYLSILIIIILLYKHFPSFILLISLQDFLSFFNDIQIYTSYLFHPLISLLIHIILRTVGLIGIIFIIKRILPSLSYKIIPIVYSIIFIIFFINIPYKGYILILLSLFPISLFEIAILINIASIPSYLCQIIGHRLYVFNDYKLSLLISMIILCSIIILTLLNNRKYKRKNL